MNKLTKIAMAVAVSGVALLGVTAPSMAVTPPPMNDAVVIAHDDECTSPRHAHDADVGVSTQSRSVTAASASVTATAASPLPHQSRTTPTIPGLFGSNNSNDPGLFGKGSRHGSDSLGRTHIHHRHDCAEPPE